MDGISMTTPPTNQLMSRDSLLNLIDTGLRSGELRYARRLCASWLTVLPGDLQVNLLFARAYYLEKSTALQQHAVPILEELCNLDPEFLDAQELLAEVQQVSGSSDHLVAKACANALTHGHTVNTGNNGQISSWAKNVYEARSALDKVKSGDYQQIEKAEYFIHKALVENPDTPLTAVVHLRLMESKGSMPKSAVRSLAEIYHERWPDCLQFTLTLSNQLMESGDSTQAVDLLHQAVSKDIAGQVPIRMWGTHHQYSSMWPSTLEVQNTGLNSPQNIPIPAAVASSMGWNQIPAAVSGGIGNQTLNNLRQQDFLGSNNTDKPIYVAHAFTSDSSYRSLSEPALTVQTELEKMADDLKRPHLAREDGRFPVYVVFTTRGGLEANYSADGFNVVDTELKKLASAIKGQKVNQEYWGSLLFYADDESSTQQYGLKPAPYNDPWQLKLILSDLDAMLEKQGERIGALLIIGGPEIVPFHNLPNPVEDADVDVPSDNPYSARDSNYFISDWQVGRVSGGSSTNPSSLVKVLREISNRYAPGANKYVWYRRFMGYIQELLRRGISKKESSYGYTAAVWQRASQAVFRPIGEPSDLLISPPIHTCESQDGDCSETMPPNGNGNQSSCLSLPQAHLGYFNLHGVPDGCEWYGQSDPAKPEDGPDFPVAMRPQDIRNGGSAPKMVFSEACYGANIIGKSIDEAISLKFLSSGTQAVVGSTCISYGSLSTPLSSADLLGQVFWNLLQEGFTAGESLRRAKIHLTREMNRRQGFLDAEDQKTLISFVLFGDPLAQPFRTKVSPKITPHLSDSTVPVPTVCEHSCENETETSVSLETITHLKSIVAQYLPGMNDADVSLSKEQQSGSNSCGNCGCDKKCVLSQINAKNNPQITSHRRVITLSKDFERAQHVHRQYARLTLDEQGKIIKMVVSH
jgi:hypothetical protein